ncbi:MAG: hypothetical protein U0350_35210 [Caldilineaceae bacterium]
MDSIRPSVIEPQKSYTFSDYFKLNPPVDELSRDINLFRVPADIKVLLQILVAILA